MITLRKFNIHVTGDYLHLKRIVEKLAACHDYTKEMSNTFEKFPLHDLNKTIKKLHGYANQHELFSTFMIEYNNEIVGFIATFPYRENCSQCRFCKTGDGKDHINELKEEVDIWYFIDPDYSGLGIAKKSIDLLLTEEKHITKVGACAALENIASNRVLEVNGFVTVAQSEQSCGSRNRWIKQRSN